MNTKSYYQDDLESYGRQGSDNSTNNDSPILENEEPTPQANSFSLQVPDLSTIGENQNPLIQIQVENPREQENNLQRSQQNAISEDKIINLSNHKMSSLKGFLALNAFCHLTGFLVEADILSYTAVFMMIIFMNFAMLFKMSWGSDDSGLVRGFFRISHWICLVAYFVRARAKYQGEEVDLSAWTVPGCLSIFLESFAMASTYTSSEKGIEISLKHSMWIQLFIVALKIDNAILPWSFTLFVFITFGFVSLMLALILLVICISAGLGVSYYNITGKTVVMGFGWYFLISVLNVLWGAMVMYTENMLPTHEIHLKTFFFTCLIYSVLVLAFTKIFNKTLFIFLRNEAIQELQEVGELSSHNYNIMMTSVKKLKHQYLVKITGTYYSTLEKSLQIKNKEGFNKTDPKSAVSSPVKITNQFKIKKSMSFDNIDHIFDKNSITERNVRDEADIEERDSCFVCYGADANAVIMDCGHGGMCYECAATGWEKSDKCHICRGEIRNILKVKILPQIKLAKVIDQIEKISERYYTCN